MAETGTASAYSLAHLLYSRSLKNPHLRPHKNNQLQAEKPSRVQLHG